LAIIPEYEIIGHYKCPKLLRAGYRQQYRHSDIGELSRRGIVASATILCTSAQQLARSIEFGKMTTAINAINAMLEPASRKRCFDPVVNSQTRLLVLGSLPGDQSLVRNEYYGNRQNRFWPLMSEVIGVELVPLDYPSRLQALIDHGVGLWDVVAEAHRVGSLDSNIRNRDDNDLLGLLAQFPNIEVIAFNGKTAERLGKMVLGEHLSRLQIVELPSSSPAYTLSYEEKLLKWRILCDFLHLPSR
jgi:hypoxanthine-DNA glycosylase